MRQRGGKVYHHRKRGFPLIRRPFPKDSGKRTKSSEWRGRSKRKQQGTGKERVLYRTPRNTTTLAKGGKRGQIRMNFPQWRGFPKKRSKKSPHLYLLAGKNPGIAATNRRNHIFSRKGEGPLGAAKKKRGKVKENRREVFIGAEGGEGGKPPHSARAKKGKVNLGRETLRRNQRIPEKEGRPPRKEGPEPRAGNKESRSSRASGGNLLQDTPTAKKTKCPGGKKKQGYS